MGLSWGEERCVGSTQRSLEYLEHRVCTANSGAGMEGCVKTGMDSCFLTQRSRSGVERRGEVLNGAQSKDQGLFLYKKVSHNMGPPHV